MAESTSLTTDEIELLLIALDAWEAQPTLNGMVGGMLMALGSKDEADFRAKAEEKEAAIKTETNQRRRRAIMLRAKLVQMEDAATAGEFAASVLG